MHCSLSKISLLAALLMGCGSPPAPGVASPSAAASVPSSASRPAQTPPATAAETATQTSAAPQEPLSTEINLIDPGAEPRRRLRYKFAGVKQGDAILEIQMTVATTIGDRAALNASIPTLRGTIHYKPTRVSPAGDLTYAFEITSFDATPDPQTPASLLSGIQADLVKMRGRKGTSTVTPRGEVLSVDMDTQPNMNEKVARAVEGVTRRIHEIVVWLPEQEIGKGATWVMLSKFSAGGASGVRKTTHMLADVSGDLLTIATSIVEEAEPQQVDAPDLPAGAKMTLETFESKGTGTSKLDLNKLVGNGSLSPNQSSTSKIEVQGQVITMKTDVGTTFSVRPKK